jgi:hypothetical protein
MRVDRLGIDASVLGIRVDRLGIDASVLGIRVDAEPTRLHPLDGFPLERRYIA